MGEEALLHDSTLACLGDAELRGVALVSKEARKHALVFMSVATYKCVGVTGEATLAPLQLVDREDDARRGACRCAPSLTVAALRARIARAVGRDTSSINLRILAPRERTLEKLRDGTRLGDYLPDAALPSRLTLSVIVTERIVVADFDYDSDETDISRFDPDVYADAQAPWRNH
jgi:hypothetical protein